MKIVTGSAVFFKKLILRYMKVIHISMNIKFSVLWPFDKDELYRGFFH